MSLEGKNIFSWGSLFGECPRTFDITGDNFTGPSAFVIFINDILNGSLLFENSAGLPRPLFRTDSGNEMRNKGNDKFVGLIEFIVFLKFLGFIFT